MSANQLDQWPSGVSSDDFPIYRPRRMGFLGHWLDGEWAIKAYGIQHRTLKGDEPIVRGDHAQAAREHVSRMLPLTREEGAFYKTGFAVLHEGVLANWLLFQWWTHQDVWCQLLSYSNSDDPLAFMHSTRPVRACVYETAVIWYEQKSWIRHILNGSPDRRAYLEDAMRDEYC